MVCEERCVKKKENMGAYFFFARTDVVGWGYCQLMGGGRVGDLRLAAVSPLTGTRIG